MFYGCNQKDHISLTYDDGPSNYTESILDTLQSYNLKATFFVNGANVTLERRAIVKRIVEEGHILGIHSWKHEDLTLLKNEEIEEMINMTSNLFFNITSK